MIFEILKVGVIVLGFVTPFVGIGCSSGETASGAKQRTGLWLEVTTISGYPLRDQPVEPAEGFEVTQDGKVSHFVNGGHTQTREFSSEEMERIRSILGKASLERDPAVVIDAASTVLTVYKNGKSIGSAASGRHDVNTVPNQVLAVIRGRFGGSE